MVIARTPKEVSDPQDFLGDRADFGPPLFAQLVPFAVHLAASIYEERRDRLINTQIVDQLEALSMRIHETLRSLGLPGSLQALEKPLGIPQSLLHHAEEVRQANAIDRVQRAFADTARLKSQDEATFNEGVEALKAEEEEDERQRRLYGERLWTRQRSREANPALFAKVDEIEGYFKSAANSDKLVTDKWRECEPTLRILAGTDRELAAAVPASRHVSIPAQLEREASRLRAALNDLSRLERFRASKIESLRAKAKQDDISKVILVETGRLERAYPNTPIAAAHFEEFFEKRLSERYDGDIASVQRDAAEQDEMLKELERINGAFLVARQSEGEGRNKERERALQRLEEAYLRYKECVSNVEVGRKFYNDLSPIVRGFRDEAREWAFRRRSEATTLEK